MMDRKKHDILRKHINRCIFILVAFFPFSISLGNSVTETDSLKADFLAPPASCKPMTLWYWMNGHVSKQGITLDLEAMSRIGIGKALIFDGGLNLPDGPAGYMNPLWRSLLMHTLQEGKRLGVEIGLHNSPGWSSSGGPWITPEQSMKYLVWSEVTVEGGQALHLELPEPESNLKYYRDAHVIAFPASPGEINPWQDQVTSVTLRNGTTVNPTILSDGKRATSIHLTDGNYIQFEFAESCPVGAVTVEPGLEENYPGMEFEASVNGKVFQSLGRIIRRGGFGIPISETINIPTTQARFYRLTPSRPGHVGEIAFHHGPRIEDWSFKTNQNYRPGTQVVLPENPRNARAVDPARVIDLTTHMDANGILQWDAPEGHWTILRFGCTTTGHLNVSASTAGTGLECDKLDPEAATYNFENTVGRIIEEAGPETVKNLTFMAIDSYEAGMQNWTPGFAQVFRDAAGYDIIHYLPAMTGRIVGDARTSERFLFDFRRAQADRMIEAYYQTLMNLAHDKGLQYYVEGYGQSVFDELQASGMPDIPMAEFWERTPWTPNRTVKMVTSAAHIRGKPIVACEAFTGEEKTSRWLNYPYSLKAEGDFMMSLGINQMVFHRFTHQPHPTAVPGMAMGPWGFHFDRTNTWFDKSKSWLDYLARCQYLLRQGHYVADVLYFVGERPPNLPQWFMPALPEGHTYDLIHARDLLERTRARDGRIVLPNGAEYRVLLLPESLKGVTPELMEKLAELIRNGVMVIGPKPKYSLTLRNFPEGNKKVRKLADSLWDPDSEKRAFTYDELPIDKAFQRIDMIADFEYTGRTPDIAISWSHRSTKDADIYFLANRQRRNDRFHAKFRITGKQPEIWYPESGKCQKVLCFSMDETQTTVPLQLGPSESVFVIFRDTVRDKPLEWVKKDGEPVWVSRIAQSEEEKAITDHFTMLVWAKPDIELRLMPGESAHGKLDETGKFYAICADEGDLRFGTGHCTAGLAVGRNGAYIIERSSTDSPAVLVSQRPIAGWNHFAVVYDKGTPRLYMNGQLIKEGKKTGKTVHPGIGSPRPSNSTRFYFRALQNIADSSDIPAPVSQGRAFYHEGNQTRPELVAHTMTADEILVHYQKGLPEPEMEMDLELVEDKGGNLMAEVWKTGDYSLSNGSKWHSDVSQPVTIDGPWTVQFEKNRRAPDSVQLPKLISLHRHTDPGVRYFSGRATYRNRFSLAQDWLSENRRVILNLGRVEVLADISVNSKNLGTVWKEPYQLDITEAVVPGDNLLEITVTTLWPNRMIGDEQLPPEYEYASGNNRSIKTVPDWYVQGMPKPAGGRVTFTTWKFYEKDEPLIASGLLGPVKIYNPVIVKVSQ
jgi:hypothetical protein